MPKDESVKRFLEPSNLIFGGKVALITGGTRGIGAATATSVAELGAKVVITGRRGREGRLFSEKSSRCTGQSLPLDGGLTAQRPYVTQPVNQEWAAMEEQRLAGKLDQ